MTTSITQFRGIGNSPSITNQKGGAGDSAQVPADIIVSVTGTESTSSKPVTLDNQTSIVLFSSSVAHYITIGPSGTTVATTDIYVPADTMVWLWAPPAQAWVFDYRTIS